MEEGRHTLRAGRGAPLIHARDNTVYIYYIGVCNMTLIILTCVQTFGDGGSVDQVALTKTTGDGRIRCPQLHSSFHHVGVVEIPKYTQFSCMYEVLQET
jgi:hypothetical protein